jgi:hypothetical protein
MRKFTALAILTLLILALAGCGKEEPQPSAPTTIATEPTTEPTTQPPTTEPKFQPDACKDFFGSWTHACVLDGNLMALPEYTGDATSFTVTWTFQEDGTYSVATDAQMEQAIANYETQLVDYMVHSRYRMFVAECNRLGRYEAYIQKQWEDNGLGAQVRQEMEESVAALDLRGRFGQLNLTGEYYVEDSELYLDELPHTCILEEGKLTLSQGIPELCDLLPIPLELTKVVE